jgi:hypothetical protein
LLQSAGALCNAKESIDLPASFGQLYPTYDEMRVAYFEDSENQERLLAIKAEIKIVVIFMDHRQTNCF